MYDAQGSLVCHEKYQNYEPLYEEFNPIVSLLSPTPLISPAAKPTGLAGKCGRHNERQKCSEGLFCENGICKAPADVYHLLATMTGSTLEDCQTYSGPGIVNCAISESAINGKCGRQGSGEYFRCPPGQFCTSEGNCGYITPQQSSPNCVGYSGKGIKNCAREISSTDKCFDQDEFKACSANKFCLPSGQCVGQQPTSELASDACLYYSGSGITNCTRPTTTPRAYLAPAGTTTPQPKYSMTTENNQIIASIKSGKSGSITEVPNISSSYACDAACKKSSTCKAFSFSTNPQTCKNTDALRQNINKQYKNGAVYGYK